MIGITGIGSIEKVAILQLYQFIILKVIRTQKYLRGVIYDV